MIRLGAFAFALLGAVAIGAAQDNYEIQVYGSDTVKKGKTMFELHSNYTAWGSPNVVNGVRAQDHFFHETIEITHGFTNDFELGFYLFTAYQREQGFHVIGSHLRPRWKAPESWGWKFGASLSMEVGYQKRDFSEDTWTLELRPIIDKQFGKLYVALNPTLERALAGLNSAQGFVFSPNVKVAYDVTKKITLGLEYYGSVGPVTQWSPMSNQDHQLFPSIDLDMGEEWEFNFGVGFGLNTNSEGTIIKMILGRRFNF